MFTRWRLPRLSLRTSNCSLLLIYLPRKDDRLTRPGWLTYNGRFTHISGHPSAAGRAQVYMESLPVNLKTNVLPLTYHATNQSTSSLHCCKHCLHIASWQMRRSHRTCIFGTLTRYGHIKTAEQRTIIQHYSHWYTGRWWVGCYIWYSEEGPRRVAAPPSPIVDVPNVTAHPSTVSVQTSYHSMWHYNWVKIVGRVKVLPALKPRRAKKFLKCQLANMQGWHENITVIGTLVVDGWAVTARRELQ